MLNILPNEEKKKVFMEYRLRFLTVAVFAFTALVCASLVLLTPLYLLAVSKYKSVSDNLVTLQANQSHEEQEKAVNAEIVGVNKKINLFLKGDKEKHLLPSEVILRIIETKIPAIKIQGFSYDVNVDRERLEITGIANDRENLAAFVETLKKDKIFTTVNLPISSYVKSTNIEFSIVLERTFPKTPVKK